MLVHEEPDKNLVSRSSRSNELCVRREGAGGVAKIAEIHPRFHFDNAAAGRG
jgi:hypothetical protein